MFRLLLAALLGALPAPALAEPALATLIVKVEKVSPRGGDVRAAVYTRTTYPLDNAEPVVDGVVPAKSGETIVTMSGIAPGEYAVKVFQDFNRNGEFDMNWLGLPLEKYGFSNDAKPAFSEPSFNATRLELHSGTNVIVIHLQ